MDSQKIGEVGGSLEAALNAKIERHFRRSDTNPDVLAQLLADKRSPNTRREYEKDANKFFLTMTGHLATQDSVLEFLHLEERQAVSLVLKYKALLLQQGLKEATVNRRLAALKSLVAMGRKLGVCSYNLDNVSSEKQQKYRDTTGITAETFKLVLAVCDLSTVKGLRDYALLRLLWGNALRRNEVSLLDVRDFDPEARTLQIQGKGKGTFREEIDLGEPTNDAISDWLAAADARPDSPLFISLDRCHHGHRLTGDGIRKTVASLCQKAGIKKAMSPHRIRHSAITAALDATDGNVRKVQKLSRHAQIDTLLIYDDNRAKDQQEVSQMLDELV